MAYYDVDFRGQVSFKQCIEEDFPAVFEEIQYCGFQDGWKTVTFTPKHGDHNPNWRDCERYLEACIWRDLHKKFECPVLPFERGLVDRRCQCTDENYWLLMLEFCKVYREMSKINRKCKRDGMLTFMYNNGEIGCNLFSDTQEEKAEPSDESTQSSH
jgi:hypothetical protein